MRLPGISLYKKLSFIPLVFTYLTLLILPLAFADTSTSAVDTMVVQAMDLDQMKDAARKRASGGTDAAGEQDDLVQDVEKRYPIQEIVIPFYPQSSQIEPKKPEEWDPAYSPNWDPIPYMRGPVTFDPKEINTYEIDHDRLMDITGNFSDSFIDQVKGAIGTGNIQGAAQMIEQELGAPVAVIE